MTMLATSYDTGTQNQCCSEDLERFTKNYEVSEKKSACYAYAAQARCLRRCMLDAIRVGHKAVHKRAAVVQTTGRDSLDRN